MTRAQMVTILRGAEAALREGNALRAIGESERVIAQDPAHLPALEVLVRALWQVGDMPRLSATLSSMISLNPYEPGYFSLLGAAQQSLGRLGDAIVSFTRSAELAERPDESTLAMLADLKNYQAQLITDLLHEDAFFRAEYGRDAVGACRARGFEIEPPMRKAVVYTDRSAPVFLGTRPS